MSLENIKKIKQGVNTANLLNHLETEIEPPKQFGLRFRFQGIIDKNIEQVKLLNNAVFPTKYDESFYNEVLTWGPDFNWMALYNDIAVGAMSCKIEDKSLHILTLGVLKPYRRLGVAAKLYEKIKYICEQNPDLKKVSVHVQVDNEAAIKFFEHLGFKQETLVKDHYAPEVTPRDAYIYSLTL